MNLSADITSLSVVSFLNNPDTIAGLTTELPTYLAKANTVDPQMDVSEWWKDNTEDLPNWFCAAKKGGPNLTIIWCSRESFFHF